MTTNLTLRGKIKIQKPEPPTIQITLRLKRDLYNKLKKISDGKETTVQKALNQIVEEAFKNAQIS